MATAVPILGKLPIKFQLLILLPILGLVIFLGSTDLLSLTDADLSLLAISPEQKAFVEQKQQEAKDKQLDKSKGHIKKSNKGNPCPPPKGCFKDPDEVIIDPPTGNIIDLRGNVIVSASDAIGGGGAMDKTLASFLLKAKNIPYFLSF